jgi:antitoxin (DNA-binding transcriptional repressor) of toxin-antitoxin stability system
MILIPLTEINDVKSLIKKIERGETCVITKDGYPFAELIPLKKKKQGWKRKIKKIKLPDGVSLQKIVEEERELS